VRANSNKAAARITLFPGRKCDAQMMKNSACRHRRSGSNSLSRIVAENRNNPGERVFAVRAFVNRRERKAGRCGARHVLIGAATDAERQSKQRQPREEQSVLLFRRRPQIKAARRWSNHSAGKIQPRAAAGNVFARASLKSSANEIELSLKLKVVAHQFVQISEANVLLLVWATRDLKKTYFIV
jgi:hypothetical protein